MQGTGTLAPLLGNHSYTENEKIVLGYFFTNVDKNIYCATDAMSSQLWAFLTGQYSRSSLSMRDRLLQLFFDMQKAFETGKISAAEYVTIDEFAASLGSNSKNAVLKAFDKKAADFLERLGVKYGHNSLKDNDVVRVIVEGVSQVFTKVIEAPFPALGAFQEKSTRYMNFSADSLMMPSELVGTEDERKLRDLQTRLMTLYIESLPKTIKILEQSNILSRNPDLDDAAYGRALSAKAFDMLRYLLPTSITTALGATFSTRTLESHLSFMLSHPLEEVRLIANSIHEEALKITPGLLKFVAVNKYEQLRRTAGEKATEQIFSAHTLPLHKGISDALRVSLIKVDQNLDATILASFLYANASSISVSFADCLKIINTMNPEEKVSLMKQALENRGLYDRFPREIQHGNILIEFVCDFGAYRDIQRHRASHQLWQGATGLIGYDYPEFFELPAFDEIRTQYDILMTESTEFARYIAKKYSAHVAEYTTALGHLIRTTFEMDPGQIAYVLELRTTPQGHQSYRRLFQELARQLRPHAPLFFKYIRLNENLEATRIAEEKAAAKKLK